MNTGYYLFVTSDPDLSDYGFSPCPRTKVGSAYDLAIARLSNRLWPLYSRTRYKNKIVPGVFIAVYIGGTKKCGRHIIGYCTVDSITTWKYSDGLVDDEKFLTERPFRAVLLKDVVVLDNPVSFIEKLPQLSIKPVNEKYWGIIMQGGVVKLSPDDWQMIFN